MIKVVLVSASFGDGHRQVGRALREAFEQQGATVYDVDSFQKTNPKLANIQQRMYEWMTRYFAGIYGMTYRWTAKLPVNHFLWRFLALSSSKGVEEAVSRIQPDIVLQLFPDYSTVKLHRLNGKPYIGIVLTDYSVHSHWFHTNADAYFIPDGNLRPNVEPFKTDGIDVVEVGVPVRYQFQQTEISLGHMRPYILFATGGRGLFRDLQELLTTVLENLPDYDLYVLCGRNTHMLKTIETQAGKTARLHGLPYIEDVAKWYQNASFAVVKAGGLTVSECLCSCCPMIFYRPDPGQESDNAVFMERRGVGKIIHDPKELKALIANRMISTNLVQMKEACSALARPNAANEIVQFVMSKLRIT